MTTISSTPAVNSTHMSSRDLFERYDISHYGFLPTEEPLTRLPNPYYEPWERIITKLDRLIASNTFYDEINKLPILDTSLLLTVPEWRRAYVILSFFTHAHIWSGPIPHEVLPPNISRPLIEVSNYLGLPPTATYPALNLWNCTLAQPHLLHDITNPDHVQIQHTFTGTYDEKWFYAVSVSVEAKGREAIELMLETIDAASQNDDERVLVLLEAFGDVIGQLGAILQRMHEHCDPAVFYHRIRPFLAGSRGMEHAGLPRGILYDEGPGMTSQWRRYSGGSNAQSALIQFLDIALGVRHESAGNGTGQSSNNNDKKSGQMSDKDVKQTYLEEMRNYMPRSHRQFLTHFATIATIREYAATKDPQDAIAQAFDRAVSALTAFRDVHIKIVARYIIAQSRAKPSTTSMVASENMKKVNIASASTATSETSTTSDGNSLRGTGGTDLIAFLKQTRDETRAAGVRSESMVKKATKVPIPCE